jgi:hypothetical protein
MILFANEPFRYWNFDFVTDVYLQTSQLVGHFFDLFWYP